MRCWSRTLQVGSVLTQAMGIAAAASQQPGPAALQLLVVPGNPGLCSFYQRFMSELWGLFDGRADVWAVSHAGHDSDNLTQGRVFCLESQIDHKVALLREHVLAPGRPPVVVLAHSIGSFIMLQAIQRLEEEQPDAARRIIKVVLLMPFLATDWGSSRQRLLKLLSGAAPVLGSIAAAVARLPEWMKDLVARLAAPGAEPDFFFRQGMHQLMSYNGVRNNFNLAWHEFRDLDLAEVDWQLIRRLGQRVSVVCAPDDLWFPAQHYQQMTAALPGVEEVRHESLSHAFCTDSWQCAEVARLVAGFVATAQASASQADMAVEVEDGERPKVVQAPAGAEIARVPVG